MKLYVTPDEFKNKYGLNLRESLASDTNESDQAERFINSVTIHLMEWIDANTFRVLDYDFLNPVQKEHWKEAIMQQTFYTFKEGAKALGLSSGMDDERGVIIPLAQLQQVEICPGCLNSLRTAGLLNFNVKNRPRFMKGWPGMGFFGIGDEVFGQTAPENPSPAPTPTPTPTPAPNVIEGIGYTED